MLADHIDVYAETYTDSGKAVQTVIECQMEQAAYKDSQVLLI